MSPALRLVALLLLLPLSAFAQTLTPSGDAHVRGGSAANNNYGSVVLLGVRTASNALNTYWSYIKFNTSGVSGQVSSAKLRVFTALSGKGSVQTNLYAVPATWGETTITWNNKPALGTQLGSFTVNTTGYVWKEIDVTAHVQAQLAQGAVGFALANPSQSSQLTGIQARESSNPAQLVITTNGAPTVSLTSPANNGTFTAPANIPLAATAADSDGTITSVEFFHGTTSITTLTSAPYSFTWTGVPQGAYVLTAKATDNLGATTTSAPVSITVQASVAQLHFIHVDHLNTPRVVANQQGQTVWRWDQQEPFGVNAPDENPSGLGTFDLPLRLPGQYFDKETNLHYNYFRDYDSGTGRYVQADPLGTATTWPRVPTTGLNHLYAYVENGPLRATDPRGLVKWSGWGKSLVLGPYGRDEYELESECRCGTQVRIKVTVNSVGPGKGGSSTRDEAEFEDDLECPNPMAFAGPAFGFTATIAFRYGVSYSRIQIGRAVSSGWSAVEGIGASIGPSGGAADVEIISSKECCKK
jgi:RHS repeat-associated protein